MASAVGIANSALIKLGAGRIIALTDDNKNAKLCNEQYDKMRLELLRAHNWNFAIKRVKLAQLGAVPAFEWDHAYQLPSDWLRTITVHGDDDGITQPRYKIEGSTVVSNFNDIWLRYVSDVTDVGLFDSSFAEVLAWRLALDLAPSIVQSNTTTQVAEEGFKRSLREAKANDAIEDYPDQPPESSWITVRGGFSEGFGF